MKDYRKLFINDDYKAIQSDWDAVLGTWWHENKKENKMKNKKIMLTEEECYTEIINLYDTVAKKLGFKNVESLEYDCRKICVSKNVYEKINAYYKDQGMDAQSFAMRWVSFGPKANLEDKDCVVEIEDGFILEK